MLCLYRAYRKSITHSHTMQDILILLSQCITCYNIVTIVVGNQEVCEIIIEKSLSLDSSNENNDTNKFRMNKKRRQQQVNILSIR